jgi:glycogen(starch) synthase
MRILHVTQRYPPAIGGAETWCAGVARWQAAQGHDVRVLTLRAVQDDELWGDAEPLPAPIGVGITDEDRGVHVRRCKPARFGFTGSNLLGRLKLSSWTCSHSPEMYGLLPRAARWADVVHAHTLPAAHIFAAWVAARMTRRPYLLTPHFHEGEPVHEQPPVRWLLRHADGVVVVTETEAALLAARGVAADRITCATNAVDPAALGAAAGARASVRAALGVESDVPLLCFVGRKQSNKGIDVLLEALPHVRHRPRPAIVLAGPTTGWYRQLLRPETRIARVIDLPMLSERAKAELLGASDLLVLPSRGEAFGIVFLEAWAVGIPVIGAAIPAVCEALGDAGVTFPPDDPVGLAAAIDGVLADPGAARERTARGRRRVIESHTWERVGRAVASAYERALVARGPRAARALLTPSERTP